MSDSEDVERGVATLRQGSEELRSDESSEDSLGKLGGEDVAFCVECGGVFRESELAETMLYDEPRCVHCLRAS